MCLVTADDVFAGRSPEVDRVYAAFRNARARLVQRLAEVNVVELTPRATLLERIRAIHGDKAPEVLHMMAEEVK